MLSVTIEQIKQETSDSKTFVLQPNEPFVYEAGQFLTVLFNRNGIEERRSYSFSSSPFTDKLPAITIKRTENGAYSRWWMDDATVGTRLSVLPPAGVFTMLWQHNPRDIFFAAAGSGITPVFSLIKTALVEEQQSNIHLFYSNSSQQQTIFYKQLLALEAAHANLNITWLFSNNQDLNFARLSTYNLQRLIKAQIKYDAPKAVMYTCGPFYYMQMVQITWLTLGFAKSQFRRELYSVNALPAAERRFYDKKNRVITLMMQGEQIAVDVPWNKTILEAAADKGIVLPYNCSAGRCSACVCTLKAGRVWMHYNEVLTEEDEAAGKVLTCTGHPATDDVVIVV